MVLKPSCEVLDSCSTAPTGAPLPWLRITTAQELLAEIISAAQHSDQLKALIHFFSFSEDLFRFALVMNENPACSKG